METAAGQVSHDQVALNPGYQDKQGGKENTIMPILWLILGIISVGFSVVLYLYQEEWRHVHWSWSQLFNMETATVVALFVGLSLLVVAIVEYIWRKYYLTK